MTDRNDLVTVIAEVLENHHWWFVGNLGVPGMADQRGYKCSCGWETSDRESTDLGDPHRHVAESIAVMMRLQELMRGGGDD